MTRKPDVSMMWKLFAGLCTATLLGTSCSTEQIAAVANGVAAIAGGEQDDDPSFSDWLADEVKDW